MTPSTASIQLFATPKRNSRFQVNANGSPVHKPPVSILKDVVMKQRIPTRQLSQASSRNSSGSSNGNPFQWDPSPMQSGKPSALQRSPNARKGHRRQNCVRISLDTPTILGGNSRSLSPVMHGIQEEASEFEVPKTWFASPAPACASRPLPSLPDTSTCEPRLNTATLRTSLMPSSPTLSLANFFQEQNRLSGPAAGSSSIRPSPQKHLSKSYTAAASLGTIPAFPSPVRSSQAQSILTPALSVSKSSTEITSSTSSPDTSDLISKNSISHEPPPKIKPSPDKTSPRRCVGRKLDTVQFQAFVSTTQSMNESKLETMDILNRNIFNLAIFGPSHRTRGESLVGSSPACSPKSTPLRKDKQGVQVPTPPTVEKASGNEVPLPGSHSTASLLPINDVLGDPPLAQSVLALRRMNSDVNDLWRSDRRYRRMKREESPALEVEKAEQDTGANWIGPVEINEGATNVAAGKERLLEIKEEEPSDNILIAKDRATALSELTFPDALRKATSEGSAIERRLNPAVFDSHRQSKPIHRTIWEDDKSFRPGNHPPSADSVAMPVQWLRNPTKSPPHLRPMARPSLANRKSSATPAKQPISPDRREASKENQPPNAPNAPVGGVSKDLERSEVARRRERDRMIKPVFHGTPKRSSLMRKSAMLTALTQMEGVEATEKEVGTPGSLYDREGFLVC
ncbi:hypothetical protein P152DRAFT_457279 [Eremomyces bilateralis CBS 781.70]|uniref:Uncharacterized protein n=1 Tax=Eremomyces bilateralis CBS 781.70 TaxID=1392243 RepID=A0A6G1G7J4_9PEZI|nr:uncharacterized protein P152DRAFT_457279 [Eremomyces bilateralis CBS 781.70]KAF1813901.1 hypothetical protein P152DRAFT_457279 [Eremomyces bilateralis CBS 781.70]